MAIFFLIAAFIGFGLWRLLDQRNHMDQQLTGWFIIWLGIILLSVVTFLWKP